MMQTIITFSVGGLAALFLWPHLDSISRGLLVLASVFAAISIQNGTWLEDSRALRREARDQRSQAYRELKDWMKGKKI